MPKRRQLLASVGIAGLLSIGLGSIAMAHPHHGHPFRSFDNIRIDHQGTNAFTATPGHRDLVLGLGGDDVINSLDRHDHVFGGRGNDTINTGEGRDLAVGGPGDDTITGGPDPDSIHAGRGADTVLAEDGAIDRIRCGPGEDAYTADPQDRVARDCENNITN